MTTLRPSPPQPMPPVDRCASKADFDALRRGRRAAGTSLWLRWAPDPTLARPRVAFAIAGRHGKAVDRNRLRRRLRAALAALGDRLEPGRYLVGPRSRAAGISYAMVRDDLEAMLAETASADTAGPTRRSSA
ncbi:MAG TPA: hypothetical protein DEP66_03290 [Acidimicrobiaceae bacterium]|nr:hypothetical protein [Acidimicrobiaceae bacterium]HCB37241.1 hypothetical protein [Acidimicrobiaceae bacterium]